MRTSQNAEIDPLLLGYFSVSSAAKLLRINNTRKIYGWLDGWKGSTKGPLIERDFTGNAVSFLDLIEVRFINFFRQEGVKISTIRKATVALRNKWKISHPLATKNSDKFITDRREIFIVAAESENDKEVYNLVSGQGEMWLAIENSIANGVVFDQYNSLAVSFRPLVHECPNVTVNPAVAFGRPTIGKDPVPTEKVFNMWGVEQRNIAALAKWFNLSEGHALEAIKFEEIVRK